MGKKKPPSIKDHKEPSSIRIKFYEGLGYAPVRQAKKHRPNYKTT